MLPSGDRQTLSADGNTDPKVYVGPVALSLSAGFGGGTAVLQRRDKTGVFIPVVNGSFTALTDTVFDFPVTSLNELQVDISGSTTPTLAVWIQGQTPQ